MHAMQCIWADIGHAVGNVSRYQLNCSVRHWKVVKVTIKYLWKMRNYILIKSSWDLILIKYTNSFIRTYQEDDSFTF